MRKLSELSTVEFAKTLCEIAEPAERLFSDSEVLDSLAKMKNLREEARGNTIVYMARLMSSIVPVMLGETHINDVCVIVSAIKGVSVDEVRQQPGVDTMHDLWDMLVGDKELLNFFRPRAAREAEEN